MTSMKVVQIVIFCLIFFFTLNDASARNEPRTPLVSDDVERRGALLPYLNVVPNFWSKIDELNEQVLKILKPT